MKPVSFIVAGAGGRGTGYAAYATHHSELAELVGVAEPREIPRMRLATEHDVPPENLFLN